jgi:uncharacterized protein YukE
MKPDDSTMRVDYAALNAARTRFAEEAAEFADLKAPLAHQQRLLDQGCGQVSAQVLDGATEFMLAWQATFDVVTESAGLIAGNLGNYATDLTAVDIRHAAEIRL